MILAKYGLVIPSPRSDFQGAIVLRSRSNLGLLSKEIGDFNSDSTNGPRETSHIASARSITSSHSRAASSPSDSEMAVRVFFRERFENLTLFPS